MPDESEKSEKSDKSEKFEKSENQEISGDIESYPKPEKLGNLENAANLRQSMKPTNVDSIPALNQIVATSMEVQEEGERRERGRERGGREEGERRERGGREEGERRELLILYRKSKETSSSELWCNYGGR